MKFLFIDGEKICVFKDDKVRVYESGYIEKYRAQALASAKNNEWKKKSRTEMLMTEDFFFDSDEGFYAYVHSVAPCQRFVGNIFEISRRREKDGSARRFLQRSRI